MTKLWIVYASCICVSAITPPNVAAAERTNIVVMMVDDMGFAGPSLAPYSNPHYKTPGMDRLAREGMLFTDFHSSGAICSATRAGLLTGQHLLHRRRHLCAQGNILRHKHD